MSGPSAIIICQKGLKLSQGVAALLRHEGIPADSLEGGYEGWLKKDLPVVATEKLPPRNGQGRTIWNDARS